MKELRFENNKNLAVEDNEIKFYFDLFHVTSIFLYPLKTSETLWSSDIFRGYIKGPVT